MRRGVAELDGEGEVVGGIVVMRYGGNALDTIAAVKDKLEQYAPGVAWFQGKQACENYLRYAEGLRPALDWGEQPFRLGRTRVFVSPNPSPANAAFSLDELTDWMRRLQVLRLSLK